MVYKIDFYRDENGRSELLDFINTLLLSSGTNKDARIQYDKIYSQLEMLREKGTNLPAKYTKHIEEEFGNSGRAKTEYSISAVLMMDLSCFIISARQQRRLRAVKLNAQNVNEMIISGGTKMKYEDVRTWDDFVEYAKSTSPEAKAEMEKLDRIVEAVVFASDSLNEIGMGLELYNLDEIEEPAEAIPATA